MSDSTSPLWDRESFVERLRSLGMSRYHHEHPFHRAMNEGRLTRDQIRGWVANRFYYQMRIPIKDAAILSNCPVREIRRVWLHRIVDHDGKEPGEGGLEAWLGLGEAAGLTHEELWDERHVLPGARFAVDAYVTFTRTKPWPVAIAASLTELFAPDLMKERLAAFEKYYPWVASRGLEYFRRRVTQARADSEEGLHLTLDHCTTRELQETAVRALSFKCDLLWSMLDAIALAYGIGPEVGVVNASEKTPPETRGSKAYSGPPMGEGERGTVRPRLSRKARLQADPLSGKPVLLYPEGLLMLSPTSEAIVRLCDGERTLGDIVGTLAQRYDTSVEMLEADVTRHLERLQERNLVEFQSEGTRS